MKRNKEKVDKLTACLLDSNEDEIGEAFLNLNLIKHSSCSALASDLLYLRLKKVISDTDENQHV